MIDAALQKEMMAALKFYADNGVEHCLLDEVQDHTKFEPPAPVLPIQNDQSAISIASQARVATEQSAQQPQYLGTSEAAAAAVKSASEAKTLEELKAAIEAFEGIAIKKTATNIVFGDGNPKAKIMVIGEAPGADEDRVGIPFVGQSGQLLDKILKCIDLDRTAEEASQAVYITNILNWRPPGNRTPTPSEIELSLPFIEKHIQLIQPDFLILLGGVPAKALLNSSETISKLRKSVHEYTPVTKELSKDAKPITAIATYHPSYLLKTPQQKRAVWEDMLTLKAKITNKK